MYDLGDVVELAPDDARKLVVVLRRASGDPIEIVDSSGRLFAASLAIDGARVRAKLEAERRPPVAPRLQVTLAQGVPKGAKMDFVIEKATELGVARIIPFTSSRTIGAAERAGKIERWRRLAKSSAQQCGRRDLAEIEEPLDFAALLARFASYQRVLVPWELAEAAPLRTALPLLLADVRTVLVAIGPEGGLSKDEAELAQAAGAHLISLGSRIFRTETAGLVACSALLYESGDL